MPLDITAELDRLDKMRKEDPEQITFTYQKLFDMPEGHLILIDLMDRFFEFKKPGDMEQVGSQAVLIYIKNTILGKVDTSFIEPPQETGDPNVDQH